MALEGMKYEVEAKWKEKKRVISQRIIPDTKRFWYPPDLSCSGHGCMLIDQVMGAITKSHQSISLAIQPQLLGIGPGLRTGDVLAANNPHTVASAVATRGSNWSCIQPSIRRREIPARRSARGIRIISKENQPHPCQAGHVSVKVRIATELGKSADIPQAVYAPHVPEGRGEGGGEGSRSFHHEHSFSAVQGPGQVLIQAQTGIYLFAMSTHVD
ncbi:hypothetical protein BJV74DRAFT_987078 [Russula compacta]|nr:hypothetical protein BJV74DRAFT_987078 [Russula compacta]